MVGVVSATDVADNRITAGRLERFVSCAQAIQTRVTMDPTPGVRYIGRWVVSTALPIVGLFMLLARLLAAAGTSLSIGGSILLFGATFMAVLTIYIASIEISQRRRAAASGARLIPRIQGYMPGNVDMLFHMISRVETDYIGKEFDYQG